MGERTGGTGAAEQLPEPAARELERPLRFAVFGGSVVSEWENPAATTVRLVLTELVRQGHDAAFYEPRNNPTMRAMLRARGAEGLRAFGSRWPDVHYRSIDLPLDRDLDVWLASQLARLVATSDVVIVLDTAPEVIRAGIARMSNPRLVRVLFRAQDVEFPDAAQYTFVAEPLGVRPDEGPTSPGGTLTLGPVTSPAAWVTARPGRDPKSIALLAYEEPDHGTLSALVGHLTSSGYVITKRLALGPWADDDWERVVESDLDAVLESTGAAVVLPGGSDAHSRLLAQGRAFVTLALGLPTLALGSPSDYPLLRELGLLWEDATTAPFARSVEALRAALPAAVWVETQVNDLKGRAGEILLHQLRMM